jgi:DNA polymerase III epsilon subunit-like protein
MKYVSIDIETTGLDPQKCQILQIGAVIEDTNRVIPLDQLAKFNCIVEHQEYVGQPTALAMNAKILKVLGDMERLVDKEERVNYRKVNNIVPVGMVAQSFSMWLIANGFKATETGAVKINAAGKNFATFDKLFLQNIIGWTSKIQMRQRIIDPAILFVDWINDDSLPNLNSCIRRAGLDGEVSHDALDDAIDVIRVIRAKTDNYSKLV